MQQSPDWSELASFPGLCQLHGLHFDAVKRPRSESYNARPQVEVQGRETIRLFLGEVPCPETWA